MPYPSRFVRPDNPARLVVQARDRRVCQFLYEHRYLTTDHLHELVFAGSKRRAQERLRRLWEHHYLDRTPHVRADWHTTGQTPPMQFLYSLARRGAELVSTELNTPMGVIPHTPSQNQHGFKTLDHHLVVTDFLVAVTKASHQSTDIDLVNHDREHTLRRRLGQADVPIPRPWLVPDGAVTLRLPDYPEPVTFYLEVVRATPPGGNACIYTKLKRYRHVLHDGHLPRLWQHQQVAAVLFVTPTATRAESLRAHAARLSAAAHRFWFTAYLAPTPAGLRSAFTSASVLSPLWRDGHGHDRALPTPLLT